MNPLPTWKALPTWAKLATIPMIIAGFVIVAEVTMVILFATVDLVDTATERIRKFFRGKIGPRIIEGGKQAG